MKIHGLLLAAGASKRLGRPKQLLEIQQKTLLEWSTLALLQTCDEVTVLLGAEQEKSLEILHLLQKDYDNLHVQINSKWQEGMGSTLAEGLSKLKPFHHVLIHLVDMPFINGFHLKYLINHFEKHPSKALVSSYQGQSAPPVIIPQALFSLVTNWKGDQGLGKFWKENPSLVDPLELGLAYRDIDTEEDWQKISNEF